MLQMELSPTQQCAHTRVATLAIGVVSVAA